MSEVGKFAEWAIVEIMGHRVFAGFVTEHIIAGKGFIRIDVPEVRLSMFGNDRSAAYTKVFGPDAVFSISPCSEDYVRKTVAGRGTEVMTGAKLLTPPNPAPAMTDEQDSRIKSMLDSIRDNSHPASEPRKAAENHCLECKCDISIHRVWCDECEAARDALSDREREAADDARMANIVVFDESHVLTPADMDAFAKRMGIEPKQCDCSSHPFQVCDICQGVTGADEVDNVPFVVPDNPFDNNKKFTDPIDHEPF